MKKRLLALIVLIISGLPAPVPAQVSVHFNIGVQPVWGPVGYDYVDYYYMPDIEAYYYVPRGEYIFYDGGTWITTRSLPPRYSNFDLYHAHKVVINEPSPWTHHDRYKGQYGKYKGHRGQPIIRDSRNEKYYANPGHPQHGKWKAGKGNSGHGNPGRGNSGGNVHGNPGRGNSGGGKGHGNSGKGNGGGKGHGGGNKGK